MNASKKRKRFDSTLSTGKGSKASVLSDGSRGNRHQKVSQTRAGSGVSSNSRRWRSFDDALVFAHSLNITSQRQWESWCKGGVRPVDIPSHPEQAYADCGWGGWRHWLNTKQWRPFDDALVFAQMLTLKSRAEWLTWCESGARPVDIPFSPDRTYAGCGWAGWGHWLGTGNVVGRVKRQ
jgi:hypothetical protein